MKVTKKFANCFLLILCVAFVFCLGLTLGGAKVSIAEEIAYPCFQAEIFERGEVDLEDIVGDEVVVYGMDENISQLAAGNNDSIFLKIENFVKQYWIWFAVGGGALLLILIILMIALVKRKKKKKQKVQKENKTHDDKSQKTEEKIPVVDGAQSGISGISNFEVKVEEVGTAQTAAKSEGVETLQTSLTKSVSNEANLHNQTTQFVYEQPTGYGCNNWIPDSIQSADVKNVETLLKLLEKAYAEQNRKMLDEFEIAQSLQGRLGEFSQSAARRRESSVISEYEEEKRKLEEIREKRKQLELSRDKQKLEELKNKRQILEVNQEIIKRRLAKKLKEKKDN